jgi:hypothetical protein
MVSENIPTKNNPDRFPKPFRIVIPGYLHISIYSSQPFSAQEKSAIKYKSLLPSF